MKTLKIWPSIETTLVPRWNSWSLCGAHHSIELLWCVWNIATQHRVQGTQKQQIELKTAILFFSLGGTAHLVQHDIYIVPSLLEFISWDVLLIMNHMLYIEYYGDSMSFGWILDGPVKMLISVFQTSWSMYNALWALFYKLGRTSHHVQYVLYRVLWSLHESWVTIGRPKLCTREVVCTLTFASTVFWHPYFISWDVLLIMCTMYCRGHYSSSD